MRIWIISKLSKRSFMYSAKKIKHAVKKPIDRVRSIITQEYIDWAEQEMTQQNYTEASRRWKVAIRSLGNYATPGMFVRLSSALVETKKYDEARDSLLEAIKKNPNYISAHIHLFRLELGQGNYKRSVKIWKDLSKRFNSHVKLKYWLEFSELYRKHDQISHSEEIIRDGLMDWPLFEDFLVESAEIDIQKNEYEKALSTLHVLVEKFEKDPSNTRPSSKVIQARFYTSILSRLTHRPSLIEQIKSYKPKNNKIVIYTAISGGYDSIKIPETLDTHFDYVIFTDEKIPNTGIFDVRPLPFIHSDSTRSARYVKTHPHTLLSDYDTAVWVDANIMITGDINTCINDFTQSAKPLAAIPHPLRTTVYEEASECLKRRKDDGATIVTQMNHYRDVGFEGRGLAETNFMIFDLKNPSLASFLDTWWKEIDSHSKRDQLSFGYSLYVTKTNFHPIMKQPNSTRNSRDFIIVPHSLADSVSDKLLAIFQKNKSISAKVTPSVTQKSRKIPAIDVVVCVHNALDDVTICLDSIAKHRSDNVRLIIIDDGSDTDTKDYLKRFVESKKWASLYRNKTASGYTKAANMGISKSTADLVVLANSDTVVTKGWTEKMAQAVYSRPKLGIVGPMSSAASHQSIPDHLSKNNQTAINGLPPGVSIEKMNSYCEKWSRDDVKPLVPLVHGFCFGITRELINAIGMFDEKSFPRGYGEENDYCFRATNAGFGLIIATDTYIFHTKSKSYSDPAKRIALMKEGGQKLRELHGAERVQRAVSTMQNNPQLVRMREKAATLYTS